MSNSKRRAAKAQAEVQGAAVPQGEAQGQVAEAEAVLANAKAQAKAAREAATKAKQDERAQVKAARKAEYAAKLVEWERKRQSVDPRFEHKVVSVVGRGVGGRPCRVVIRCQHEGCENTREIATQDLFQVEYCLSHRTPKSRGETKADQA